MNQQTLGANPLGRKLSFYSAIDVCTAEVVLLLPLVRDFSPVGADVMTCRNGKRGLEHILNMFCSCCAHLQPFSSAMEPQAAAILVLAV